MLRKIDHAWWQVRRFFRDLWSMMRGRPMTMTIEDMERELEIRYGIPREHKVDA